ncbi:formate/nitrite transporter family protein [Neisseriaceae bacterium ESL0693]|nr:formate/nitrite transporter family protein [Neisseriaceae bacterium ESL0693]
MKQKDQNLSRHDQVVLKEHEKLPPRLMYEIVRHHGTAELNRPANALIFSGITAGIVITFSFVFKAILTALLPANAIWTPLIANMGYTVGFLLVILGHLQLFTENTITTVVPLFHPLTFGKLRKVLRLWGIVFVSNIIGTAIAAAFLLNSHLFSVEFVAALNQITRHVASLSVSENLIRGIPAGILIASLVWMLPTAGNKFILIFFFIYLISLGEFTHVVVGSAEMLYGLYQGHVSLSQYFFSFLIPTGLGNIIGGTGIFTLLIYGQVNDELPDTE